MRAQAQVLGASIFVLAIAGSSTAFAADARECSGAAEEGQQQRASGRYLAAREKFLQCSAPACPAVVKADCARWASELLEAVPTIVIDARDASGKDLTKVKVIADGNVIATELDGRGIPIDPGKHTLRFEAEGHPPVTEEILAKENVKGRRIAITFGNGQVDVTEKPAPKEPERTREHTVFPWILVGVGIASVSGGAAFFVARPSLPENCDVETEQCVRRPQQSDVDYKRDQDEAGNHVLYPTYGAVLLVVGGVLVAGGLVWHFLEPTGPKSSARVRLTPSGFAGTF